MTTKCSNLYQEFEARSVNPEEFRHLQHVQVAYQTLQNDDFLKAAVKYTAAIQEIATKAGAPKKFNLTITMAFLSLIGERIQLSSTTNFDEFIADNPDLLDKSLLEQWYSSDRLLCDLARKQYLLPDKTA